MKVKFPVDGEHVEFDIKNGILFTEKQKKGKSNVNVKDAVYSALQTPTSALSFDLFLRGKEKLLVVVSDYTRKLPYHLILPFLFDYIFEKAKFKGRVDIIIASGMHRLMSDSEIRKVYGDLSKRGVGIFRHNAFSEKDLVEVSEISGYKISFNRKFFKYDAVLLTGLIEPHLLAGFSGGLKAIFPGISGFETMKLIHGYDMLESQVGPGVVKNNNYRNLINSILEPYYEKIFVLNFTMNEENGITGVFAGHPVLSFEEGVNFLKKNSVISSDAVFDTVVVSGGGAPLDLSFYQSIKGYLSAINIVRKGGKIVLISGCKEGVGSNEFQNIIESFTPESFEEKIKDRRNFFHDQWMAHHLIQIKRLARLYFYSPNEVVRKKVDKWVKSVDFKELLQLLKVEEENGNKIALLPNAPYTLITLKNSYRCLNLRFAED